MDKSHILTEIVPEIVEDYEGERTDDGDVPVRAVKTILIDEHGLSEQEAHDVFQHVSGPNGIDVEVTASGGVYIHG
ncbi:ANTAR domain-containing protein [Halorientalis persicus]|uniref:ANTAR domain-containing protein n=1 Tax=Halorientalis persicus TaxID=1367881 RepID=A0A1H8RBK3_9EURY|nr:ANTAR domain-containing protein [Halorientalis persicus]SEO63722.1 ANTAR domain-containing protein [Halorientalis persicus]